MGVFRTACMPRIAWGGVVGIATITHLYWQGRLREEKQRAYTVVCVCVCVCVRVCVCIREK